MGTARRAQRPPEVPRDASKLPAFLSKKSTQSLPSMPSRRGTMTAWTETYQGGVEAERLMFERLAVDMMRVQYKTRAHAKAAEIQRAFHSKAVFASIDAELIFENDLPEDRRVGFAQPGRSYPAILRLSNASGFGQPDYKPDLRGLAVRIKVSHEEEHDLLATNFPVSHARDARQFVAFAKATAGGRISQLCGIIGLLFSFGPSETMRMIRNVT